MLTGKRHGLSVGHAALVLFAFPLGISFCSLLLFLPLAGLMAALVAAIRLCLNLVETPALGEPFCASKVKPSKADKRLHRRMQKHIRKHIRRAKKHAWEQRAAISSAAFWMKDILTVCAVVVRMVMPLLAAIVALGLVDILLHVIATTVNLGCMLGCSSVVAHIADGCRFYVCAALVSFHVSIADSF